MSGPLHISIWGRNEIDSFGLRHILTEPDFIIDRVLSGEAEARFSEWEDGPDRLILIDSPSVPPILPRYSALRAALPIARVVLLCDACDMDTAKQAFSMGIDGLLSTHLAAEPLLCAVRLVATGMKVMPSEIIQHLVADAPPSILRDKNPRDARPELSEREIQILHCLAAGEANKDIASRLAVAEATVKAHVKAILRKLQVDNRTQAAIWAINQGKIAENDESATTAEY